MTKSHNLAVFEEGQGKPLVLLHGLISTHRYWKQVIEHLDTTKWNIITPDLLGFGDSPKPRDADYDIAQQVACIKKSLGSKYKQPYTLVGHSLGAIVALQWAVNQPQLFNGVVLSGLPLVHKETRYRQLASGAESRQIRSELLAKLSLHSFGLLSLLPPRLMRIHKSWPAHIAEDWAKQSYRAFKTSLRSDTQYANTLLQQVKELKVPTQLLIGKHDDMIRSNELKQLKSIARDNKNITIQVINGGHNIPLRFSEVVAQAILQV